MTTWRIPGVLLLSLMLAGCMYPEDEPRERKRDGFDISLDDSDFDGLPTRTGLAEGDRSAILTDDGVIRLGLTDREIYLRLSDSARVRIGNEVASEMDQELGTEGLKGFVGSAVKKGVSGALGMRRKVPLDEVRDLRWSRGELVFEVEPGSDWEPDRLKIDGDRVTRRFAEADARRFIAEFRRAKAARAP